MSDLTQGLDTFINSVLIVHVLYLYFELFTIRRQTNQHCYYNEENLKMGNYESECSLYYVFGSSIIL